MKRNHQLSTTIDHVIPRVYGGNDNWRNRKLAHHWCNTVKGAKLRLSPKQVYSLHGDMVLRFKRAGIEIKKIDLVIARDRIGCPQPQHRGTMNALPNWLARWQDDGGAWPDLSPSGREGATAAESPLVIKNVGGE